VAGLDVFCGRVELVIWITAGCGCDLDVRMDLKVEVEIMGLSIRRFKDSDLQLLYELLSDEEVMCYIEPPFSFEQARAFLENAALTDIPLIYAVEDEIKVFIGYVIYHDYEENSKEIGWILKKQFWGKGFAEALTERLIQKANIEGKSAVIECSPEQEVTKHIAKKFGFMHVGLIDGCDVYQLDLHSTDHGSHTAIIGGGEQKRKI